MEYLAQHIESLIFTCEQPISLKEIKAALEQTFESKFKEEDLKATLKELSESYQSDTRSFELVKIAGGYQFLTKGAFHATVGTFLKQTIKKRLSRAALETLAIIAYKQPVTKTDIENIRGVNCDYAAQKLLEKELISIVGRKEAPGRPLLYGTSQKFMDYFGIENLQDLPKLKEFQPTENSIGEAAPIEEEVSGEYGSTKREDDVIDVAIAVANIYSPLPPDEDEDNDNNGGNDNNDGTPVADQENPSMEVEESDSNTETNEAPTTTTTGDEDTSEDTEIVDAVSPTTTTEDEIVNEEENMEFIQETVGEFTNESTPKPADGAEVENISENFTEVENVVSTEELNTDTPKED